MRSLSFFLFYTWICAALAVAPTLYNNIRVDAPLTELNNWNLCFQSPYSENSGFNLDDLLTACDSDNLVFVCRQDELETIDLYARVERADFLSVLNGAPTLYNGAYWYYNTSAPRAVGFAEDDMIALGATCDTNEPLQGTRMCWRLSSTEEIIFGGRCGASGYLSTGTGGNYLREIYFDPCRGEANGVTCDDISFCTANDTCSGQVCVGSPLPEPERGQCFEDPVCDRLTGVFSNVTLFEGTACTDNDWCTDGDFCDGGGVCISGPERPCPSPPGQCYEEGVCQNTTQTCTYDFSSTSKSCSDGQYCTINDKCDGAGGCVGGGLQQCLGGAQCRLPGVCNETLNTCIFDVAPDGFACVLNNLCVNSSECSNGNCVPVNTVECGAPTQCEISRECNNLSGECEIELQPDGFICDDGDPCTFDDECVNGICKGTPTPCPTPPQCYDENICIGGVCVPQPSAVGAPCTDGNACTDPDTCNGAGSCIPGAAVVCPAPSQCQQAVACNPLTGCPFIPKADGTPCDDQDICTINDECQDGSCSGGEIDFYNPICFGEVISGGTTGLPGDAAAALPSIFD